MIQRPRRLRRKEGRYQAPSYDETGLRKTNRFLILTVLLAFLILNLVYFGILSSSINNERLRIMEGAAAQLTQRFQSLASENMSLQEGNRLLQEDIYALSQLTDAKIWIVRNNGEIIYATEIPVSILREHPRSALSGKVVLPARYSGANFPETGLKMQGGRFMGLFEDEGGSWLSVTRPLYNHIGVHVASIQLHERIDFGDYFRTYLINGIAMTSVVGIIVALIFIAIINRQISYPLAQLAKTADQIRMGDLSARVDMPQYFTGDEGRLLPTRSLSSLVDTFNAMVDHLENDAAEQRNFIAAITHDLRTPLTSILGFLSGMLDGTIPPELHERYIGIARQEAEHMKALIQDMTLAGTMDQAKPMDFQEIILRDLLSEVIEGMEPQFLAKELTVRTSFAPSPSGQPIRIIGDREALTRVLSNLLNNAVKFTPEKGIIAVSTRIEKDGPRRIEVHIEDSGPGIDPADTHAVFERFYKVDRSRTGKAGSGLGLFIVRSLLAEHGQHIKVGRSELGGAAFVFTLPLA